MMDNEILKYAYAGLLHDIGKFYQRTEIYSNLTENEKENAPMHPQFGYRTHLHSAYTHRFFKRYLQLYGELERAASAHHIKNLDKFDDIIRQADLIASRVDRNDEAFDNESVHKKSKYRYITSRMHSIMTEIDFGKDRKDAVFPLTTLDKVTLPKTNFDILDKEIASAEYKKLFNSFIEEVEKDNLLIGDVTPYKFHRMYALLCKYTTLIPASTYETNMPTVSLFDHLKLTSAISSCLIDSQKKKFYMLEFDVSGIQKFIYKIAEGKDTKPQIAKSFRGRSAFISLLTNSITYAILNEFSLTQSNIIFNTGGGAVILLPYLENTRERIKQLCSKITKDLFSRFNTNLTFVYAIEEVDDKELELFKTEKALSLKNQLDKSKHQKFKNIIDKNFSFQSLNGEYLCGLCGETIVKNEKEYCKNCNDIIEVSNYYTSHDNFSVYYYFDDYKDVTLDLGFVGIKFENHLKMNVVNSTKFFYVDAVNHFEFGNVKLLANLVPKDEKNKVLSFEEIANSLDSKCYGDNKLAILKMDVDNLGAIFAFGLKQGDEHELELQRSLSKYLTLSRFVELFFSLILKNICKDVSKKLQDKYENIFYINYAGGDDLVIIGPVYAIVQLTKEIREKFKAYVNNPNITLSGGIHIQGSKKPIRFGIKQADVALEKSKAFKVNEKIIKDSITLIDVTIPFNKFSDLLKKVEKYRNYVVGNEVSRTSFYNIMSQIQCNNIDEYYITIPKIEYTLYRQLGENNPVRFELMKEFASVKSIDELSEIILMMKLVILFTREVNKNGLSDSKQ